MRTTICSGKRVLLLETDGWEYAERKKGKSAVVVIAVTEDGRLLLTEQQRPPVDARVIELPAGLVGDEDDLDAAATAKKELEEETGHVCDSVELLARGPASAGITSEILSYFRATGVRRVGEGGGVGSESITVHAIPVSRIERWLRAKEDEGVLIDLKVWGALYFLDRR